MNRRALLSAIGLSALVVACGGREDAAQSAPPPDAGPASGAAPTPEAAAQFDAVVEDVSKRYFTLYPEIATYSGAPAALAPGADARLTVRDVAAEEKRRAEGAAWLEALKGVDPDALDPVRQRTRATLITLLDGAMAPARIVDYGDVFSIYGVCFSVYPFIQNSGPLVDVPNLMQAQQKIATIHDAENYLSRLQALPGVLDGALDKMKHDVALGVVPPDFVIDKTVAVIDGFVDGCADENILYKNYVQKLADIGVSEEDAEFYGVAAHTSIDDGVIPAYGRVRAYLEELRPQASHDAGIWRLPKGKELYQAMIRHMTDTDLTAKDIHEIGLKEVARITAQMDALLKANGYEAGTVGERMAQMGGETRFVYPDTDEGKAAIMNDIKDQLAGVKAALPQWFGHLPKYDVEVRAVPAFSQDSAPGGYYDPPAHDGSRPGIYWINLRDTAIWPHFSVPTLTYHEAIPGHHLQSAIALEQETPLISAVIYSNASVEGWALYAEALAAEMGLYADDPFGDIGRLRDELHRAVRLVVDTGMHSMKWSREKAIDYMVATEGVERSDAVSEIERYAVWPGQALGYKIGMLKIEELRQEAEAALGEDFDIREFHDEVLKVGSSALPVIESHIHDWLAEKTTSQ